jgi:hypothetical protein
MASPEFGAGIWPFGQFVDRYASVEDVARALERQDAMATQRLVQDALYGPIDD